MNILEDFKRFQNKFGLIEDRPVNEARDPNTGNGWSYSGESALVLIENGFVPNNIFNQEIEFHRYLTRHPEWIELAGPEDVLGWFVVARSTFSFLNVRESALDEWFGWTHLTKMWRKFEIKATCMWLTGIRPSLLRRFYWSICVAVMGRDDPKKNPHGFAMNTDGMAIGRMLISPFTHFGYKPAWFERWAIKKFEARVIRVFGSYREAYITRVNAGRDHAFHKWVKGPKKEGENNEKT